MRTGRTFNQNHSPRIIIGIALHRASEIVVILHVQLYMYSVKNRNETSVIPRPVHPELIFGPIPLLLCNDNGKILWIVAVVVNLTCTSPCRAPSLRHSVKRNRNSFFLTRKSRGGQLLAGRPPHRSVGQQLIDSQRVVKCFLCQKTLWTIHLYLQ